MKRLLLFCLIFISFSGRAIAQEMVTDSVKKNADFYQQSVYAELLGNGVGGSLNYERRFYLLSSKKTMILRLGGMYIPDGSKNGKLNYEMTVPFEISFLRGKKNTKFEMGLGITY